ncbi:hypothetical protein [Paractinoplanes durhamensis]|uniref:hypothetical protein n=1 Tax=Paractinoplanes durhamensis TaxID=113563 RepID=UPI00362AB451
MTKIQDIVARLREDPSCVFAPPGDGAPRSPMDCPPTCASSTPSAEVWPCSPTRRSGG